MKTIILTFSFGLLILVGCTTKPNFLFMRAFDQYPSEQVKLLSHEHNSFRVLGIISDFDSSHAVFYISAEDFELLIEKAPATLIPSKELPTYYTGKFGLPHAADLIHHQIFIRTDMDLCVVREPATGKTSIYFESQQ